VKKVGPATLGRAEEVLEPLGGARRAKKRRLSYGSWSSSVALSSAACSQNDTVVPLPSSDLMVTSLPWAVIMRCTIARPRRRAPPSC
jgi:hypothetical protein